MNCLQRLKPVFASIMVHLARETRENSKCIVERRQEDPDLVVQDLEASLLVKGSAADPIGEREHRRAGSEA